jgi:hypothetical protein
MNGETIAARHFLPSLVADGRPLLSLTGIALLLSGGFALFLSATGAFLPQDVDYLGMQVRDLCGIGQCRIVHFMFHDRVSFGGVLISIGTLYLWLAEFPLKDGRAWAWWTFFVSGLTGFGSFLCYLGYGYLDTWHGIATLVLLPVFIFGMWRSFSLLQGNRSINSLLQNLRPIDFKSRSGIGVMCLVFTGLGMMGAGAVIMVVGMTSVFVPEDLTYLQLTAAQVGQINPHLIPLIAHDRAGFGGGLFSSGVLVLLITLHARPSPHLWQALALAGSTGFVCAISVHFCIGYLVFSHIAPAFAGAALFVAGLILTFRDSFFTEKTLLEEN